MTNPEGGAGFRIGGLQTARIVAALLAADDGFSERDVAIMADVPYNTTRTELSKLRMALPDGLGEVAAPQRAGRTRGRPATRFRLTDRGRPALQAALAATFPHLAAGRGILRISVCAPLDTAEAYLAAIELHPDPIRRRALLDDAVEELREAHVMITRSDAVAPDAGVPPIASPLEEVATDIIARYGAARGAALTWDAIGRRDAALANADRLRRDEIVDRLKRAAEAATVDEILWGPGEAAISVEDGIDCALLAKAELGLGGGSGVHAWLCQADRAAMNLRKAFDLIEDRIRAGAEPEADLTARGLANAHALCQHAEFGSQYAALCSRLGDRTPEWLTNLLGRYHAGVFAETGPGAASARVHSPWARTAEPAEDDSGARHSAVAAEENAILLSDEVSRVFLGWQVDAVPPGMGAQP